MLHLKSIIEITTIFVTVTSIYIVIKPIIATQKEHTTLKRKYNELIYDENIFPISFFNKNFDLTDVDKVNKISIGNPDAEICLTLIFSPICVSCIKELQKLMTHPSKKSQYQIGFNIFVRPKETSRIDSNSFPYSLWLSKAIPIICHDTKKIC